MIGETISHYKILEKLGEGGMGVVYKAEDTKLKRTVAVKFLPSKITRSDTDKARFLQEAQAAAALNHSNVCTIHEIHDEGENPFIVMEYVEGKTLRDIITSVGAKHSGDDGGKGDKIHSGNASPLRIPDVIDYAIQIAEALKAAHKKGIVHRDIKSENIMVTETGQVKVMDFGLAKLRGSVKLTKSSSTVGTMAYMSPEHLQGKDVDGRTDIFSFGVVLYEMLAGLFPFKGEYDSAMMYSILNEEPEPIQKHRSDLSSELLHVLNRALEKNRDERYQSVNDMLIDLKRHERDTSKISGKGMPTLKYGGDKEKQNVSKKRRYIFTFSCIAVMVVLVGIILIVIKRNRPIDSLAILPFTYPSDQPDIRYLSEGIPDRILFKLQKLPNLKRVIPFTSVLQYYREGLPDVRVVGKEFGVKAVGIGRISMIGENLEINIEIVDVKKNNLILKEPYTVELAQMVNIPIIIAQDIFNKLGHELTGDQETHLLKRESDNSEAYQNYMMGRFYWNKRTPDGIQSAIEYFNRAITQDSSFALAYAGLADAYLVLPQYSAIALDDVWESAKKAAVRAKVLAPYSSEACVVNALLLANECKWEESRIEIQKAIALDPNNSFAYFTYGMILGILDEMEGAVTEIKRALRLDPLSMVANRNLGWAYSIQHQYDKAIEQFEKTLAIDPNEPYTYLFLGGVYFLKKDTEKFILNTQKFYELMHLSNIREIITKSFPDGNFQSSFMTRYFSGIQNEIQRTGHPILNEPVFQAMSLALLGDADSLFLMLHKTVDLRDYQLHIFLRSPILDPFRSDPRFREVLKRVNLDQYYE